MSTVVGTGTLLVGVDVVEVARIARLLDRESERMHRTIATPAEVAWVSDAGPGAATVRTAALFAVKEAVIKALGGRPPRFRWPQIELVATRGHAVEPVLDAFAAGVGLAASTDVLVVLSGGCLDRVGLRLGRASAAVVGRWGVRDGRVFAAAVCRRGDR